jgi:outer membrane protein assembly complex protein YaeT
LTIGPKLRLALIVLLGLVLGVVSLLLVLHSPPVQRYALGRLQGLLHDRGIQFEAAALCYSLLRFSVDLSGVAIRSATAPDLPVFARIARVRASLGFRDLIRGAYTVQDALVQGLDVQFVIDEQGRDNLPRWLQDDPAPEDARADFVISELRVPDGAARFEDRARAISVHLPLWRLDVGGVRPFSQEVRFQTDRPGRATFETRELGIERFGFDAVVRLAGLELRSLELHTDGSQIRLAGTWQNFADPVFDTRMAGMVGLASLAEFAGIRQRITGEIALDIAAKGPLNELEVRAEMEGENLTVEQFERLAISASAEYALATQRIQVSSFVINSPSGVLSGGAALALTAQAGRSSVNARLRNLDLERLLAPYGPPVRVASRVTGAVNASWPGLEFARAQGQADLRLTPTRTQATPELLPLSGSLSVRGREDRITIALNPIELLAATFQGDVVIQQQDRLQGQIRAIFAEVGAWVETFAPAASGIAGPAEADITLAGTLSRPAVSAVLTAPAMQIGRLQNVSVSAIAGYSPERLAIESASLDWNEQRLEIEGAIGLSGESPALDLQARLEGASIDAILSGLERPDIPVQGLVSAAATISGTVERPQAEVILTGSGWQVYGETLGSLAARAALTDRLVQLHEFRLAQPDSGTLQVRGSYDLESRVYQMEATGNNWQFQEGRVSLSARGSGTPEDPRLQMALSSVGMTVDSRPLGPLSASVNIEGKLAAIEAQAPEYNLSANARIGMETPYPAQVRIRVQDLSLARLPVDLEPPLAGSLTATVDASGPLAEWRQGEAQAHVETLDLLWRGHPLRTEGPLNFRVTRDTLQVEQATLVSTGSRLSLAGELPDGLRLQGSFDLATLATLAQTEGAYTATGELRLEGVVRGPWDNLDPSFNFTVADGQATVPGLALPATNITLRASLREGLLSVEEARALLGPSELRVNGQAPLAILDADLPIRIPPRPEAARVSMQLEDFPLALLEALPARTGGLLSVRIEAEAPRPELAAVTGRLVFDHLRLDLAGFELDQPAPASVVVDQGLVRVEQFELRGPDTRLTVAGTVGLTGPQPLDVKLDGLADAAILAFFSDAARAAGDTVFQLAATGTLRDPQLAGFLELRDGVLSIPDPLLQAEELDLRVDLIGERITITRFRGLLNGGNLTVTGGLGYSAADIRDVHVDMEAVNIFFNVPEGLRTISNARLELRSLNDQILVGGLVTVLEGAYSEPIDILRFTAIGGNGLGLAREPDPFLARLRFNVRVVTDSPLVVDNNLARATVTADLRVVGLYDRLGLLGRIDVEEGGELYFAERTYLVERGTITFTSELRIEPSFDILSQTQAAGYDITLQLQGVPGDIDTILTSDPMLPQPDILALLVTGRTLDEARAAGLMVASEQALSYLAGRFTGEVSRAFEQALGVSQVRIEPQLIAAEADPGARLTIGQDLTRDLGLIYSMNLTNSADQIYMVEYDITRRFSTRGVRQQEGNYRFEFRHDLTFGGVPFDRPSRVRVERRIGQVGFDGAVFFTDQQLADRFRVRPGQTYDFFRIRRGLDRLEESYARQDLLESRIRMQRDIRNSSVDLSVTIRPGPRVEFIYEGWDPPGRLRDQVRDIWQRGVFDAQRLTDATEALRIALAEREYLNATMEPTITTPAPDRKRILFEIQLGQRYRQVEIVLEGAQGIAPAELLRALDRAGFDNTAYVRAREVRDLLARYYSGRGYLDARVGDLRLDVDPPARSARIIVPIEEGPLYHIGELEFQGNAVYTDAELRAALQVSRGDVFRPELRDDILTRMQGAYWRKGYNDAVIDYRFERRPDTATVDVVFEIAENQQSVVEEIRVTGTDHTSDSFVRSQLHLRPGDILILEELTRARRDLYNTGAFSLVDIEREVAAADPQAPQRPVRLNVTVQEIRPFRLRYGGFYDTDRGPGIISDFSNRNTLGSARVLGLRTRYDSDLREGRIYFSQPLLRNIPLRSTATTFVRREIQEAFTTDRAGFSILQEAHFRDHFIWNYGYRFERVHTFEPVPFDPLFPFDFTLRIAPLTSTLTRETRDDILDATRGSFTSHGIEFAPAALGSQLRFLKYFGQYFKYVPLREPQEVPLSNLLKTRLAYAAGVRVGLAGGLGGQELVVSERFFAGGGTTVRGFEQNALGPLGFDNLPVGGNAMFVLNNELRFPGISLFDGVAFLDIGNVYRSIRDFNPFEVRKSAGLGVRVRTPYLLLRLDYGIKLDRRPEESRGRIFFSIGQAF